MVEDEPMDLAGFRLQQVPATEILGGPLTEELEWAHVNEETVELWSIEGAGLSPKGHLLVRPTGDCYIAWNGGIVVRGNYEVPEALRMFQSLVIEGPPLTTEGPPPPPTPVTLCLNSQEVRVLMAFMESCLDYTYQLENQLEAEDWKVGEALRSRLKALPLS